MVPSTLSVADQIERIAAAIARVSARSRDGRSRAGARSCPGAPRGGSPPALGSFPVAVESSSRSPVTIAELLGVVRGDLGPSTPHHRGERVGQLLQPRLVGAAAVAVLGRLEEEQRERAVGRAPAGAESTVDSATMGSRSTGVPRVAPSRPLPRPSVRRRRIVSLQMPPRSTAPFHACDGSAPAASAAPSVRRTSLRRPSPPARPSPRTNPTAGRPCARARSRARARCRPDDDCRRSA